MEQEQEQKDDEFPYKDALARQIDDDEDNTGDWFCPACGVEYDEIDQEYQICHLCRYNNNPKNVNNEYRSSARDKKEGNAL